MSTPRTSRRRHNDAIDARLAGLDLPAFGNCTLRLTAAVAAICGVLYGYDTGIISAALLLITRAFHLGHTAQEMAASAILAGAVIGTLGQAACRSGSGVVARRCR